MADKFCVMCGNQFGEAHKVCGKCGNVIEVKKTFQSYVSAALETRGINICKDCGHSFPYAFKICSKCGNTTNIEKNKSVSPSAKYYKDNILHDNGFPIPSGLIKKVEELLNKESSLRLQIVCKKQRLKGLLDIKPNQTGVVSVEANNKKIKLKETTFRLLIQKDINELLEELMHDASALEEFNKKFK